VTTGSEPVRSHVDATVRTWLGLRSDDDVPRLPDELARRLLRAEEYEREHRDRWGNWEFAFCEAFRAGRLWEPDIDRWLADRRGELGGSAEPLWPDGRPFAVCLTHDVDLVGEAVTPGQMLRSMRTSLARDGDRSRRARAVRLARPGVRAARALYHGISPAPVAETLERCVELERERGVTASYFFTAYPGADAHRYDCTYDFGDLCRFRGRRMQVKDMIRALHAEGFDVGLHGSYNSALAPGLLAREKAALEAASGVGVTTTRQHFVHWDVRTTPRLQAEAGFTADSTLGFNRGVGFRAGTSLPFRWFDAEREEPLDLLQMPLLVQDGALLRSDALELGAGLGSGVIRDFIDRIADLGGLATLVFHPNNLQSADYLELFRTTIDHGLERGAWFASLRDVDEWWRTREARLHA
jgi:hypothetical protein